MAARKPIPPNVASAVLLANRHACCVCQKVQVQIHHIDSNPSNNDPANLAVLCLPHHDQATMTIGLSKKMTATAVRTYKDEWETKCANDLLALARDRLRFYATIYKNPPRLRELFAGLSADRRLNAVAELQRQIQEDVRLHDQDGGFGWQAVPGDNGLTGALMLSLRAGELWPRALPRVGGHPLDPDYPIDLSPPNGMTAFHGFDLYCQLVARVLAILNPPIALESLWSLDDANLVDQNAGALVSFRESSIGKSVVSPRAADEIPLGRIQFRVSRGSRVYRALMDIKNMYVFSDTAALNLMRSRVCGLAVLEGASSKIVTGKAELHVALKPLLIGIGGLGQSHEGFWDLRKGENGSRSTR